MVLGDPLRIVYFGLPLAALLLADDGHQIPLAVLSRPELPGERRLRALLGRTNVFLHGDLSPGDLLGRVRQLAPDLLVSWFWTTKLPTALIECNRLGALACTPRFSPAIAAPFPILRPSIRETR